MAGSVPPYAFELIAGGRSNLTYRVTDAAGHAYALRRPPVSHVLATAHDMAREHTVISALRRPTYRSRDPRAVHRPRGQRRPLLRDVLRRRPHPPRRGGLGRASPSPCGPRPASLVDTLARLHAVDPDGVGLGDFARREGYIARQLKRWHGQFEQSTLDGTPGPAVIDRAWEVLSSQIPEQQGVAIVHGDYRLDNTVLDDDGDVIAILDWEICTLGDPLADLGLLLVYWAEADDADPAVLGTAPTALPGFATRDQLVERYAAASGPRRLRRSPTTGPSDSGSWPASSRGSTCATPAGRRPATAAASTSSPTGWPDWASGPWPTWRRCEPRRPHRSVHVRPRLG